MINVNQLYSELQNLIIEGYGESTVHLSLCDKNGDSTFIDINEGTEISNNMIWLNHEQW